MFNNKATSVVYDFSIWITRLAIANLIWMLFTLLGLIIFGIVPATISLFALISAWVKEEKIDSLFKFYWLHYKRSFVWGNKLGIFLLAFLFICYVDFQFLTVYQGPFQSLIAGSLLLISILFTIALLYIFPVINHYKLTSIRQTIVNSFLIGISRLPLTILMAFSIVMIMLGFKMISGLFIFFIASLTALVMYTFAHKAILQVETKRNKLNKQ